MKPITDLYNKLLQIAEAEGGEMFMGLPARWYDKGPRWRCINQHTSKMYLKSEEKGALCLACQEPVCLTFPEDQDGPLTHSSLVS